MQILRSYKSCIDKPMVQFIRKLFMTQHQRALMDAASVGNVSKRMGYSLNSDGQFATNVFSVHTHMGTIDAIYAKQCDIVAKPTEYYCIMLSNRNNSGCVQRGSFAKAIYHQLQQRYKQKNAHAR